jgi:hypothetical protein
VVEQVSGWVRQTRQGPRALACILAVLGAVGCTLDTSPLSETGRSGGLAGEGGTGGMGGAGSGGGPVFPTGGVGGGGSGGLDLPDAGDPNDFFQLDGSVPPLDVDSSVPIDTSVDCESTGIYGLRAEIDVYWGGRNGGLVELTDNGRGTLLNYLRVTIAAVGKGGDFVGSSKLCGVELPTFFSTTLCEAYKPEFPGALFDASSMPTIAMSGQYQCLHPGCAVQLAPTAGLFGIDLRAPDAPWPIPGTLQDLDCSLGAGLNCYPDDDSDSHPGIGVKLLTSGKPGVPCGTTGQEFTYMAPPLNANPGAIFGGVVRTDRIMLGVRSALGGGGVFNADCSQADGKGTAKFLESRAAGCMHQQGSADPFMLPSGANDACSADEASFMDVNMPIYLILDEGKSPTIKVDDMSPSPGTRISLVRLGDLGDQVDCGAVRDAF